MPFTVHNLTQGRQKPETTRPDQSVREALARMIEHDFTQLPVVDAEGKPLGMVTSDSILRALNNFGESVSNPFSTESFRLPFAISVALMIVWIVGMITALNWLDTSDGLAIGP